MYESCKNSDSHKTLPPLFLQRVRQCEHHLQKGMSALQRDDENAQRAQTVCQNVSDFTNIELKDARISVK